MGVTGLLYHALRTAALAAPRATAVVGYDGRASTYEALLGAIDGAADCLTAQLEDGDVLGLAVDDPCAFLALYFAAARLGVVTVLLDSRLSEPEMERAAARFNVGRLAVDDDADEFGFALRAPGNAAERRAAARQGYEVDDFLIHLTSGSTGEPKGIVMSEAAIDARVRSWGGELALGGSDVVLCALPLAHCHGIDVLTLPTLYSGGTVAFARGGHLTARGLARQFETRGVTLISALPVMYQMLTAARGLQAASLATLRMAISGSAPLPLHTQERFLERFGMPLRQVYGLSEIGVICFDKAYVGGGSIGTPIAGIDWRLDPAEGDGSATEPLHELYVRGPALARGYYRDPAAEAEMFEDGWLRTRDLVVAEPGGWYVRGRRSSFINVAGSKVGPLEVEAVLRECSGVVEGAVVGVPDAVSSERVAALIVTDANFDRGTLSRQLGERLSPYQMPQRLEVATALPRTPLGKVDYAAVKRLMSNDEVTIT